MPQSGMWEAFTLLFEVTSAMSPERVAEQVLGLGPVVPKSPLTGSEGDAPGHRGRKAFTKGNCRPEAVLPSIRLRVFEDAHPHPHRRELENDWGTSGALGGFLSEVYPTGSEFSIPKFSPKLTSTCSFSPRNISSQRQRTCLLTRWNEHVLKGGSASPS